MRRDAALALSPDVIVRELSGESVVLDLASGRYFGLNAVGTRVWQLIQQGQSVNEVIRAGTRPETDIKIETPLIYLKKSDIVKKGVELNAPLHLTWSCYRGGERPCGTCDSCVLRAKGFAEAGTTDPAL